MLSCQKSRGYRLKSKLCYFQSNVTTYKLPKSPRTIHIWLLFWLNRFHNVRNVSFTHARPESPKSFSFVLIMWILNKSRWLNVSFMYYNHCNNVINFYGLSSSYFYKNRITIGQMVLYYDIGCKVREKIVRLLRLLDKCWLLSVDVMNRRKYFVILRVIWSDFWEYNGNKYEYSRRELTSYHRIH